MLLLDSRRDGLSTEAENLIASNLHRSGVNIDLDAISDPSSALRVLDEHPGALDGYDAVIAVSPSRTGWRGTSKVLARIVARVSGRVPTLIIDHRPGSSVPDNLPRVDDRVRWSVDTLLLSDGIEPVSAARQIAGALHVLLDHLQMQRPAAPIIAVAPPTTASLIRAEIGAVAAGRLDWITRATRDSFGLAFAGVNLLHSDSITTIAASGPLPADQPAEDSLTAIALRTPGITVMADTWLDPDAYNRTPTRGPDAIRFYAAWPIRSDTGQPIGTLCISDTTPRRAEEFDLAGLHDLALLTEGELIHAQQHAR